MQSQLIPTEQRKHLLKGYSKVFILLCVLGLLGVLGGGVVGPMLPLFAIELGATPIEIGLIRSSYFAARIFVELPIGIISDRIGRRKPIILGLLLSGVSAMICGSSPDIFQIIVGRLLWGVGNALYFASSTVLVLDLFEKDKGKALGLFHGVEFAGQLVGSPLGGTLSEYLGFRAAFYFAGLAMFCGFVLALLAKAFRDPKHKTVIKERQDVLSTFTLLRSWPLAVVSLISFLGSLNVQGIVKTLIPIFQVEDLEFTPLAIGLLGTFGIIDVIVMATFGGYLTDRIDREPVLIGGIIASAAANIGYLIFPTFLGHVAVALLNGFGEGMMIVVLPILVSDAVDKSIRDTAIGANRTVLSIGKFMGPIAATITNQFLGNIHPTIYLFTAILMAGIPLTMTMRKSYKKIKLLDYNTGLAISTIK